MGHPPKVYIFQSENVKKIFAIVFLNVGRQVYFVGKFDFGDLLRVKTPTHALCSFPLTSWLGYANLHQPNPRDERLLKDFACPVYRRYLRLYKWKFALEKIPSTTKTNKIQEKEVLSCVNRETCQVHVPLSAQFDINKNNARRCRPKLSVASCLQK